MCRVIYLFLNFLCLTTRKFRQINKTEFFSAFSETLEILEPERQTKFRQSFENRAHKLRDKIRILQYNKISWFNPRERVLKHSFAKRYLAIYVLGKGFLTRQNFHFVKT